MLSSYLHLYGLAWSLESFYFWFMMGKSSWVHSSTQGLSHHVTGKVLGLLKMVANRRWARWLYIYFSSICFYLRMSLMLAMHLKLILMSLFVSYVVFINWFWNPKLVLLFVNPFVILFPLQLCVCDVYLLNHVILVVMLIYRGPSWHSADYRVYISESMRVSTCLTGTAVLDLV